jgi:hypothetical protein
MQSVAEWCRHHSAGNGFRRGNKRYWAKYRAGIALNAATAASVA